MPYFPLLYSTSFRIHKMILSDKKVTSTTFTSHEVFQEKNKINQNYMSETHGNKTITLID